MSFAGFFESIVKFFQDLFGLGRKTSSTTYSLEIVQTSRSSPMGTTPVQSITPPYNIIYRGYASSFQAQFLANGQPYAVPSGQTLPTVTWTTDDKSATLSPLDAQNVTISIPASDTTTVINITATATAPDGTTLTATFALAVADAPVTYSMQISQTGFIG